MILKALELDFFRNYVHFQSGFDPRVNLIYGENAQGKTNLLEAIAYLSSAKSHRARYDREMIMLDIDGAFLKGSVDSRGRTFTLEAKLHRGKSRQLYSNGVRLKTAGELAGILTREDLFFERFNLHILECDCEVQQDTRLTTLAELTDWLRTMTLHGGGGTDFRPAFRHVDRLIEEGKLERLGGVLYFTDGDGVFPDVPPAYRAVFVMLRYRYDDIDLPAWAEKLILEAEAPKGDERWI